MTQSILIIVVTLLLSAFFSGMEIAYVSKNRLKLEIDRKQSRLFDFVAELFERHPGQYITSILVGNNIALVVYSLYMSLLLRSLARAAGWLPPTAEGSVIVETLLSTLLILFFAEFLPKSIVRGNPNFYYRIFAPLHLLFYVVLYPIVWFTDSFIHVVLRLCGCRMQHYEHVPQFDRVDLENLIATTPERADQEDSELKLFQNALEFADLRVRDCMVPRVDVEGVELSSSVEQLTERFVESKYSRIFVWEGSIDNIVGYVNSKSLFRQPKTLRSVLMKVHFVAETLPMQTLLEHFIKHRCSIAVVVDEFGGTAGIISLEDVLEQIFGEIEDEHDEHDMVEKRVGENEYLFSCRVEIKYLNEHYHLAIEESRDYDTLAGYIISHLGDIPSPGQVLTIDGLEIHIVRATRSRIELARVKRL